MTARSGVTGRRSDGRPDGAATRPEGRPARREALPSTNHISRAGFFLPEKVLAEVFRGKLLSSLARALRRDEITLSTTRKAARRLLRETTRTGWVVDARRPFAGPEQVLKYLSRYTHRIALTNARLVAQDDHSVTFRWKDRREGDAKKLLTLPAEEFLRRF